MYLLIRLLERWWIGRRQAGRIGLALAVTAMACAVVRPAVAQPVFRAGAARVDITPSWLPVPVNGWHGPRTAHQVRDRLFVRALVLDDGHRRLVMAVAASCFIDMPLLDEAKAKASEETGIPVDRMMVSADHAHSAPDPMQPDYRNLLVDKIVESIVMANAALEPVRIGWAMVPAYEANISRRHILRPDKTRESSYGETMRAHDTSSMGGNTISPSGPVDPMLTLVSVQTPGGQPLAVLGIFGFHFISGHQNMLSGDAAGHFGTAVARELGVAKDDDRFIGILAQGACGDTAPGIRRDSPEMFADMLAGQAAAAIRKAPHHDWAPLGMAERLISFDHRQPTAEQLEWARQTEPEPDPAPLYPGGPVPFGAEYDARQMMYLHENPTQDVRLQTIRIGDLGLVAMPYEIFGLTALKLRAQSPLPLTSVISLGNGATGYVAPPEQHFFGGYTTLFSIYSGLVEDAEPRSVELTLEMLEEITDARRVMRRPAEDAWIEAVLDANPTAFWPLDDLEGPTARDRSGNGYEGAYEEGVAFFLPGRTPSDIDVAERAVRRAALFAGGRMAADVPVAADYTISLWLWNGLAESIRDITGHIYGIGDRESPGVAGDHLFLEPVAEDTGAAVLAFANGQGAKLTGRTAIQPRTWYQVAIVRQGDKVAVYLNGRLEVDGEAAFRVPAKPRLYLGGRHDLASTLEGRLHDVAWYERALDAGQVQRLFHAQRPVARARDGVIAEIDPSAGFTSITLSLADIDITDPGVARYDRTVDYVVTRALHHEGQSGETVTFERQEAADAVDITLAMAFDYLGERFEDTATSRVQVVLNEVHPAVAEAVWSGASVLPGGGLSEWWRGANWQDRRVPPFDGQSTVVQFGQQATGMNRLGRNRTVGGMHFQHYSGTHHTDLSGHTLTVAGDLILGPDSGGGSVAITGGTLRLGSPGKPGNVLIRSGHLRLDATLDTEHLDRVLVPDSTETAGGVLTLAGAGTLQARQLHLASESVADKANANATLHIPADSQLEKILVRDSFRVAASDSGNWQTARRMGFDRGDGEWELPPAIHFEIGEADRPAAILAIGHGGGWSKRGRLVAGAGGIFRAHVEALLVGTMDRAGVGWWGSMQPEVAWTPPYGVGNDFLGTLDLAAMDRCEITAGSIRIGHPAVASWGTLLVGRVRLPTGNVRAGEITIGHSFPTSQQRDSEAFRFGSEGLLELNGTTLYVDRQLHISKTGLAVVRVAGASSGIVLGEEAEMQIEGTLRIVFAEPPMEAGHYYGLRWYGDRRADIEALIRAGRIEVAPEALEDRAGEVKVFVKEQVHDGVPVSVTHLGVE